MVTNGVTLVGQGWKNTVIKQTAAAGANSRVVTLDGGAKIEGVTLTVGTENYVKDVTLAQGTLKVDEDADWIRETVSSFESTGVSTVRFIGATDVAFLDGSYRFEGLDANVTKVGGTEYATVADAVAAGDGTVDLLWDTTRDPMSTGNYTVTTNGHALVLGSSLVCGVTDNGDGTVTVRVEGGETPEVPAAASITFVGSMVKVGVTDVQANYWYAVEKATDLAKGFTVDATTWVSGASLLAGTKDLEIALGANEPQAFYRVVVSTTAPRPTPRHSRSM